MIFDVTFNGESHEVEVHEESDRLTLRWVGGVVEFDARQVQPNIFSLLHGQEIFEARVARSAEGYRVRIGERDIEFELFDPRKLKSRRSRHADVHGPQAVSAPMPGKVVKILVSENQSVERGQGLIVVEAMKMQNELKAPRAGVVRRVNAAPGQTINAGEELVWIE